MKILLTNSNFKKIKNEIYQKMRSVKYFCITLAFGKFMWAGKKDQRLGLWLLVA